MSTYAALEAPIANADSGRFSTGPTVVDGRPVRGLVIVTSGTNETGTPAVAVWQLDLTGNPTGAWITAEDDLSSAERARQILTLCERRALVAYNEASATEILALLRRVAEVAELGVVVVDHAWVPHLCLIDTAITETAQARVAYDAAVTAEKERTRRSLAPLEWHISIPDAPDTLDKFLHAGQVPLVREAASDAATAALTMSRAVRWSVAAWADSEAARHRRVYLRRSFGAQQPLPPAWRAAAVGAYEQVLRLPTSR